jgi:diguanylate cyclase (GGDEF)-like protein
MINNQPKSKQADRMQNPLIQQAYLIVGRNQSNASQTGAASTHTFEMNGDKVDVAYASLGNQFGLSWTSIVVVPRSDFMGGINNSVLQSIGIVVLFIVLALIAGLLAIEHMLRDIRQLTAAALKVGNGEPLPRLHIHRKDEIGNLVKTFIEMENKLRFDRLTHVNNRDFLIAQIEFLQQHAEANPAERINFTLLFLDLDKFKAINDTYGHAAGDQLLIVIAARLKAAVRETDTVARFGGDEFVVLLNGTSSTHDIQTTVDKIHSLVEQPIALADHTVSIGVSVGWAIYPTEAQTYSSLVDIADARMFSRKKEYGAKRLRLVD